MRDYRRANFERVVRQITVERMADLQGRVFDTEQQAISEGYTSYETDVPRETVFNVLSEELLGNYGPGNWGVSYPMNGEGDDAHMDRQHLDVWVGDKNTISRVIPTTGRALRLVVSNPSEHDIDKK